MLPIGPIARSAITSACINLLRRRVGCDSCAPCGVPDCRGVTLRRERETPCSFVLFIESRTLRVFKRPKLKPSSRVFLRTLRYLCTRLLYTSDAADEEESVYG